MHTHSDASAHVHVHTRRCAYASLAETRRALSYHKGFSVTDSL